MKKDKEDVRTVTEQRNLKRLEMGCFARINRHLLQQMSFEAVYDHFVEQMVIKVRGEIWTEPLGVHETAYPASWWQMFKFDIMPHWFCRWFPIRWTTTLLEARILYPGYKPFREPSAVRFLPYNEEAGNEGQADKNESSL